MNNSAIFIVSKNHWPDCNILGYYRALNKLGWNCFILDPITKLEILDLIEKHDVKLIFNNNSELPKSILNKNIKIISIYNNDLFDKINANLITPITATYQIEKCVTIIDLLSQRKLYNSLISRLEFLNIPYNIINKIPVKNNNLYNGLKDQEDLLNFCANSLICVHVDDDMNQFNNLCGDLAAYGCLTVTNLSNFPCETIDRFHNQYDLINIVMDYIDNPQKRWSKIKIDSQDIVRNFNYFDELYALKPDFHLEETEKYKIIKERIIQKYLWDLESKLSFGEKYGIQTK